MDSASVCSSDSPANSELDQPPVTDQRIRRRPTRGYIIYSDDDCNSDDEDQHSTEWKPIFDDNESLTYNSDTLMGSDDGESISVPLSHQQSSIRHWIAFSLLPSYTEKVEIPPSMSRLERILASFTMYNELKDANMDSHFERVFVRLQMEWTYIGGLVCRFHLINISFDHGSFFITARSFSCVSTYYPDHSALNILIRLSFISVNTAVFSIAPGSLFTVDTYARSAIAASSITSGLGIACDAWFLFRYNWADLHTFIVSHLVFFVRLISKLHI